MEALIAPLESLLWVFTPAGAIVGLVLFGLLVSGLLGRLFPNIEVSGGTRRRHAPLDGVPQRERIAP